MLTLGIESSCDEMAAAVVRGNREILSNVVHAQHDLHRPYGGVVPELASRDHVCAVARVVETALADAGVSVGDLDGVAVTAGPGLIGSLLVGLSFGKALAWRHGLPFVGVHHLAGHLASATLGDEPLAAPFIGLVVSGGHTALYRIEGADAPKLLGETRDDAVGEAFDKVAKLLGLPYPGGPAVSAAARAGNPRAIDFPRPLAHDAGLDSRTAASRPPSHSRSLAAAAGRARSQTLAASFEAAATDVLVQRVRRAVGEALGCVWPWWGVAANLRLREVMAAAAAKDGFRTVFPPLSLCTDNAAMIAAAGAPRLARGERDGLGLNAFSRFPFARARAPRPLP